MSQPKTFEEAKALADQTYIQFWQDEADSISSNWSNEDFDLLVNAKYETVGKGRTQSQRRILPEGYEEYLEAKSYIEKGPLDFSSEETYDLLTTSPEIKGGMLTTKEQNWISEDNPLRQAVEAQSEVMQNYLDEAGIPIVTAFAEDFNKPDSFRGEGVYLNTGTGAHIDWDSSLKRGQKYETPEGSEIGEYNQVFVRPDPESILDSPFVDLVAAATGMTVPLSVLRGGDLEDVLKSVVVGQVVSTVIPENFVENNLNKIGIDAETFGMDPETFTNVLDGFQEDLEQGKDVAEAALGALGDGASEIIEGVGGSFTDVVQAVVKPIGDAVEAVTDPIIGVLDGIEDFETPEAIEQVGDTILAGVDSVVNTVTPVIKSIDENLQPIGDVIQDTIIDPVDAVIDFADSHVGDVWEHAGVTILTGGSPSQIAEAYARGMYGDKIGEKGGEILQEVFGNLGVDKDLFGFDDEEWDDWNEDVATRMAKKGTSLEDSVKRQIVGDVTGKATEELMFILDDADYLFNSAFGGLIDLTEGALGEVVDVVETVGGAAVDVAEGVGGGLVDAVNATGIPEIIEDAGDVVIDAVNATGIPKVIETVGGEVVDLAEDVGGGLVDLAEDVGGEVVDLAEDVGGGLVDVVNATGIPKVIETVGGVVVDTGGDILETGGDIVETTLKELTDVIERPVEAVVDVGGTVIETGGDIVETTLKELTDVIERPVEAVTNVIKDLDPDLPDLDIPSPGGPIGTPSSPSPATGLSGMLGQRQPTQIESLFDKELFKFDTEINIPVGMLTPTKTRRYG